jgi:hypothetical protein
MDTEKLDCVDYKDLDGQIESLMKCSPLPEKEVKALCEKAREILLVSSSFVGPVRAKAPLTSSSNTFIILALEGWRLSSLHPCSSFAIKI